MHPRGRAGCMRVGLVILSVLLISFAGCAESGGDEPVDGAPESTNTSTDTSSTPGTGSKPGTGSVTKPGWNLTMVPSITAGPAPLAVAFELDVATTDTMANLSSLPWRLHDAFGMEWANGTGVPANASIVLNVTGNQSVIFAVDIGAGTILTNETIIAVGEPLAVMLVDVAPVSTFSGMLTNIVATHTGSAEAVCTWAAADAVEVVPGAGCSAGIRFNAVGSYTATVTVAEGELVGSVEFPIESLMPVSTGRVTASLYMYNAEGAGVSNILAIALGEWHYVTGDTVSISARTVKGDHGSVDRVEQFIYTSTGTVHRGPFNTGHSGTDSWGAPSWAITKATPEGDYLLSMIAYFNDGTADFIKDTNDGGSHHKRFDITHVA